MGDSVLPGWLTRRGAVEYSGLSRATIDRAVAQGKVRSVRKGRTRLIRRESLDAWIESDEWLEFPGSGDGAAGNEGGAGAGTAGGWSPAPAPGPGSE